jgi:hypothetical protein
VFDAHVPHVSKRNSSTKSGRDILEYRRSSYISSDDVHKCGVPMPQAGLVKRKVRDSPMPLVQDSDYVFSRESKGLEHIPGYHSAVSARRLTNGITDRTLRNDPLVWMQTTKPLAQPGCSGMGQPALIDGTPEQMATKTWISSTSETSFRICKPTLLRLYSADKRFTWLGF